MKSLALILLALLCLLGVILFFKLRDKLFFSESTALRQSIEQSIKITRNTHQLALAWQLPASYQTASVKIFRYAEGYPEKSFAPTANTLIDDGLKPQTECIYYFIITPPNKATIEFEMSFSTLTYQEMMANFVISLSKQAKKKSPDFLIVPQNGTELLSNQRYRQAVDGVAREDLFFGYNGIDKKTPRNQSKKWIEILSSARDDRITVFITDYCTTPANITSAQKQAQALQFLNTQTTLALNTVPTPHPKPSGRNIRSLNDAQNFLYLLNPEKFATKQFYLDTLQTLPHDIFILDAFYNGSPLSRDEIATLRQKPDTQNRIILAYLSIGEAESYRPYWKPEWSDSHPGWIAKENPNWPENYYVEYWQEEWQSIIEIQLSQLIDAGYDGVFLDTLDSYYYFETAN